MFVLTVIPYQEQKQQKQQHLQLYAYCTSDELKANCECNDMQKYDVKKQLV